MSNITKGGVEVKVGQIWRDLDYRMKGRTITVTAVRNSRAYFLRNRHASTESSLSIARMHRHSTGWEILATFIR